MNTSPGLWRLSSHGASAGACERVMTRDGTVGRSDATERSLPLHWDIDPARVMRPRFADSIRASSPSGLREQAGHMTASDFCAATFSLARRGPSTHEAPPVHIPARRRGGAVAVRVGEPGDRLLKDRPRA